MSRSLGRLGAVILLYVGISYHGVAVSAAIPLCEDCNLNSVCSETCYDAQTEDYSYCELFTDGQCQSVTPGDDPVIPDPAPDTDVITTSAEELQELAFDYPDFD